MLVRSDHLDQARLCCDGTVGCHLVAVNASNDAPAS